MQSLLFFRDRLYSGLQDYKYIYGSVPVYWMHSKFYISLLSMDRNFIKRNEWGCPLLDANEHKPLYTGCLEKPFQEFRAWFPTSKLNEKSQ